MLFRRLELKSADDVSQLRALLDGHDILGCPISSCVAHLAIVDDQSHFRGAWGHQLLLRLPQSSPRAYCDWCIQDDTGDTLSSAPKKPTLLPSAALPRTLPATPRRLNAVRLSGLLLPSGRDLVRFIAQLGLTDRAELVLDKVAFADVSPPPAYRFRSPPQHKERNIRITVAGCPSSGEGGLSLWIPLCNIIFSSQRCALSSREHIEPLIVEHLQLFCALYKRELVLRMDSFAYRDEESTVLWSYKLNDTPSGLWASLGEVDVVSPRQDERPRRRPYISQVKFSCPSHTPGDAIPALLAHLESELLRINGGSVPRLVLLCPTLDCASAAMDGVLEGRIFARSIACTPAAAIIIDVGSEAKRFSVKDILAAPSDVVRGDEVVALSTAQRRAWVLREVGSRQCLGAL
ncbi:hypothetical protein PsYK624_118020 [Phanerochaete sordida]|uniref:Uncharacterized protein n=1 Tax=Phanerochaete sordida TaxID=48140 RepID=A0A9P3GIK1_9APHY|nr:hypothetical protein PsYK624_118020 [Phanerochaete sordida]